MSTPGTWSWRDRALTLAVPSLLVVVATVQVVRAQTLDQSSWQGTGFGMFATFESAMNRVPVATTREGERLDVPIGDELRLAQIVPTDRNLRALAEEVAELNEVPAGTTIEMELWAIDLRWSGDDLEHRIAPRWSVTVEVQ